MSTVVSTSRKAPDSAPAGPRTEAAADVRLASLVRRIADGDRPAFAELFDEISGRLVAAARSRLRDRDQAAEVAAETFVEVWWMARHHVDSDNPMAVWLVDIAARRADDRMRLERAGQNVPDGLSASPDPLAGVHRHGTGIMLASLLGRPGMDVLAPLAGAAYGLTS